MSEFTDWFYSIPFFTRYWLTLTVVLSCLEKWNFIDFIVLILRKDLFLYSFQIWRPVTALFYHPLGFPFLINCYFIYTYSGRLETGTFGGKPADYFYMLLFNWLCCVVIGLFAGSTVLMGQMVISVLYVWSLLNKDVVVSFWFGSRFRAMYLPWVLLVFNTVVNGNGTNEFIGIIVGHLAFFLLFKYPQEFGGPALLAPPAYLKQWFPDTRHIAGFGSAPARNPAAAAGHQWGRGHTLGRD